VEHDARRYLVFGCCPVIPEAERDGAVVFRSGFTRDVYLDRTMKVCLIQFMKEEGGWVERREDVAV
jgi:hypothetical protein